MRDVKPGQTWRNRKTNSEVTVVRVDNRGTSFASVTLQGGRKFVVQLYRLAALYEFVSEADNPLGDAQKEIERLKKTIQALRFKPTSEELYAALIEVYASFDAMHSVSSSTAHHGGIGGQALTPHCHELCTHKSHEAEKARLERARETVYGITGRWRASRQAENESVL